MCNCIEIWNDVIGYKGLYQVSNLGKVKSLRLNKLLKPANRGGYLRINLQKNRTKKWVSVHRLVAEHFIDNPLNKSTINHIDAVKTNNCYCNLEWNTQLENNRHARKLGLYPKLKQTEKHKAKLKEANSRKVINKDTGIIYNSITDAAIDCNLKRSTLIHYLIGSRTNKTSLAYLD